MLLRKVIGRHRVPKGRSYGRVLVTRKDRKAAIPALAEKTGSHPGNLVFTQGKLRFSRLAILEIRLTNLSNTSVLPAVAGNYQTQGRALSQ